MKYDKVYEGTRRKEAIFRSFSSYFHDESKISVTIEPIIANLLESNTKRAFSLDENPLSCLGERRQ